MKRIAKLAKLGLEDNQIISVSFVGPGTISRINREFVNHIGLTDVISFDYRDNSPAYDDVVAELIICPNAAIAEGHRRKHSSFASEMVLYLIHGILHLAGENDLTQKERTRMRRKERRIMQKLKSEFAFESIFQLWNDK